MVLITDFAAGIGGIKAALDILQGLKATTDEVAINDAKIGLQRGIIEAQTGLLAAQNAEATHLRRIDDLEKQIAGMKDWEAEKKRYRLKNVDTGATAYVYKTGMEAGEDRVWLCQTCFEDGHKSSLQLKDPNAGKGNSNTHHRYACNLCKGDVVVRYTRNPTKPDEEVAV